MQDIATRLDRLERSAHRWRAAALGLVVLIAGGMFLGQVNMTGGGGITTNKLTADRVEAGGLTAQAIATNKIIIVDGDGKERLTLGTVNKDAPYVELTTKDGKTLLSLSTDGKAASILIRDTDGKKLFSAP